ncbi:uncharacterized protein MYCFIDRAFT_173974 [Pseudocercospora fijiensis CIRAD86]|uniref:Uncharacterized protein n=1 Tax=Pseudocercospora fijiensis (strain CIRAD86) TaxID=383855 RepID=M3B711_PSEFD|nr:uncharacterized protein MYCFIDRAFT_173974 [Pseudocercospora fijiensis CIRAD86]EME85118.1 hypothetical protein MYCFIDRAFT_173974 [Pseudocercospora fijiensis CIRAD86]
MQRRRWWKLIAGRGAGFVFVCCAEVEAQTSDCGEVRKIQRNAKRGKTLNSHFLRHQQTTPLYGFVENPACGGDVMLKAVVCEGETHFTRYTAAFLNDRVSKFRVARPAVSVRVIPACRVLERNALDLPSAEALLCYRDWTPSSLPCRVQSGHFEPTLHHFQVTASSDGLRESSNDLALDGLYSAESSVMHPQQKLLPTSRTMSLNASHPGNVS